MSDETEPDPNEMVQMNVRVPRWLRDAIDARRAPFKLSRDKWVARALGFALKQPTTTARRGRVVSRTPTGSTVRPGGTP